jgi:hypothetical protein
MATSVDSDNAASWPTVLTFHACRRFAVAGPTPQTHSTGSGWRKSSSRSGGTTSNADGDGKADALADRDAEPRRDLRWGARDPLHAAHVDERLVDREAFHDRRRVVEDGEELAARRRIRRHARRDDDRVRAQPPRLPPAHRRAHTAGLRLIARREHDPGTDDHRTAAEPRVVPLLDRREERIGVRVQHEHMFVYYNAASAEQKRSISSAVL